MLQSRTGSDSQALWSRGCEEGLEGGWGAKVWGAPSFTWPRLLQTRGLGAGLGSTPSSDAQPVPNPPIPLPLPLLVPQAWLGGLLHPDLVAWVSFLPSVACGSRWVSGTAFCRWVWGLGCGEVKAGWIRRWSFLSWSCLADAPTRPVGSPGGDTLSARNLACS